MCVSRMIELLNVNADIARLCRRRKISDVSKVINSDPRQNTVTELT